MATYIIGDIQGCCDELQQLLHLADFNPENDELWITGDLVARGPKSLQTLRFVKGLGDSAKVVLGNHDLNLLAIHQGVQDDREKDKLSNLLAAPDCDELLNWLRQQPLLIRHPQFNFVMIHAGIPPQWTIPQAEHYAKQVELELQADNYKELLTAIYDNQPNSWSNQLQGSARSRFIINALTRMRYCFLDGSLEFDHTSAPEQTDLSKLKPWFEFDSLDRSSEIIFGHWGSLLGKVNKSGIYGLDTACVWGNSLTMLRWQDKKRFSLACPIYCT
ncbi:symmetrical bis(5'-nucleosyl)-tetraphosphatase [Psychromonas antarctica]|uniref:symmetrical bis(5'-nucleosyl)-tetraphosphatase n=1 Tax=Psychromonas antarctica TaxID=67573 RepID=UPI001EE91FC5|nr:symmetrical bis(5'-nucleosyl)-tetraphosphatase [Psychromonas antarctica]MCG6201903.1 symmetrical bis(5'-nucleosyl)-tetraphosphatase [Psychromonas antarctica]